MIKKTDSQFSLGRAVSALTRPDPFRSITILLNTLWQHPRLRERLRMRYPPWKICWKPRFWRSTRPTVMSLSSILKNSFLDWWHCIWEGASSVLSTSSSVFAFGNKTKSSQGTLLEVWKEFNPVTRKKATYFACASQRLISNYRLIYLCLNLDIVLCLRPTFAINQLAAWLWRHIGIGAVR